MIFKSNALLLHFFTQFNNYIYVLPTCNSDINRWLDEEYLCELTKDITCLPNLPPLSLCHVILLWSMNCMKMCRSAADCYCGNIIIVFWGDNLSTNHGNEVNRIETFHILRSVKCSQVINVSSFFQINSIIRIIPINICAKKIICVTENYGDAIIDMGERMTKHLIISDATVERNNMTLSL